MILTIAADVTIRKLPLGLPFFVTKWSGTCLWGAMIWCAVTLLDHIRSTSIGSFLPGYYFATVDLAVYALAIATMAILNNRHRQIIK
ncbi:hypothetical protein [Acetobacter oeni]|uniref:Uncharacterized protein n=1 Tax=Acetobacter oeni TaxID=304077 RepID=A0A511XMZ9_9PROT|nr:hypothetical protein [Acetobacter oeni]MBB3881531.1 hypothetical protein [Acetobacter oeni]NHO18394.1 hypothetical protein [Acetobacter oeni]GBR10721.1 hypothetical protein AA21952_3140 [Acetobacter oeni LMG 21952]GEN64317.1 hypothetical protein AOE01nite_25410 [Acetobacter oeni]